MSESKFRDDPAAFIPHIHSRDRDALAALITKPEVEKKLLQRLRKKANLYALNFSPEGEPLNDSATRKIDVDGVVELYEHYIIPLTKEVEVCPCFLAQALLTDGPLGGLFVGEVGRVVEGGSRCTGIAAEETVAFHTMNHPDPMYLGEGTVCTQPRIITIEGQSGIMRRKGMQTTNRR